MGGSLTTAGTVCNIIVLYGLDLTIKSYCLPPSPYAPHKLVFSSSSHQAKDLLWDRQQVFVRN